jgi:DNA-binding response OmpR family regulator
MKTLIVDDDLALADVISFTLRRAGFEVSMANDGLMALERWEQDKPDCIILDLNLPKLNGLQVLKRIRAESDIPIVILSVRDGDDDVVTGLEDGADDYIVKPFSPRQLVARIESVMRRSGNINSSPNQFSAGQIKLDPIYREIYVDGKLHSHLTPLENQLLQTLMLNKDQVISSEALISHVWPDGGADHAMLKQLIYRLRIKIERVSSSIHIETIPGVGYLLATSENRQLERKI